MMSASIPLLDQYATTAISTLGRMQIKGFWNMGAMGLAAFVVYQAIRLSMPIIKPMMKDVQPTQTCATIKVGKIISARVIGPN